MREQKVELVLEGLDCANCAAQIEERIGKLDGVAKASMNFVKQIVTISIYEKIEKGSIIDQVKRIVHQLEPDVQVIEMNEQRQQGGKREQEKLIRTSARFILGVILFIGALWLTDIFRIQLGLYIASYIIIGGDIVWRAIKNIGRGRIFDENFLMTIATIGAFAIREYPEAVAVMLFYQIGELFQSVAINKSRKSIAALMDIRPDFAHIQCAEGIQTVDPKEVQVGDFILIKPGERVPLDGIVIKGSSQIDTSALTGETIPRTLREGERVLSGSINISGILTVEVEKVFGDSTVAKILDLVQNASSRKAPTENFITKFARYYTPFVVFSAAALAILPPLILQDRSFSLWFSRALIFLVVSCPCALVVSIPLSFFGGIGAASKKGILVKGGNYLEALSRVSTVVFDKTGTLTKGVFKVIKLVPQIEFSEQQLLYYGAYGEMHSNHPIARSIRETYKEKLDQNKVSEYTEIPGLGVKAVIDGKNVAVGNNKLMHTEGISFHEVMGAGTIVHIAVDGQYGGYMIIADEVKEDSAATVEALIQEGIQKIAIVTGDKTSAAEHIARIVNIHEVYAELLPGQKVEIVEKLDLQKGKGKLVFVGDGINDAPVLARADIGIAMGGVGSDAAIEAADVVLMTDEPYKLVEAIKIAKKTQKIVWQNIGIALGVKFLVLLLGAMGLASMWAAVFADVGVALIAVMNALRIVKVR